jgi:hypothetical protein
VTSAVQQIDHIIIEAADEQAVFDWFTSNLALPVAWPMAQWGLIHEGGVCVGDVNLGCNHVLDPSSDAAPTIRAIALQPAGGFEMALPELERCGIAYSEALASPDDLALPDELRDLPWANGWTNRIVVPWRPDVPVAFFCHYHHDSEQRRAQDVGRVQAAGGGRLGIERLQELVVASTDVAADIGKWRDLLGPAAEPEPGLLQVGKGPDLRVVRGDADRYAALVFEVESLARAATALDELEIRYERGGQIRLDPADALGLDVRLAG